MDISIEERKARKAAYDKEYRLRNLEKRKKQKAEYYQRTRNPEKERIKRKAKMHKHIEYCRQPEYREKKRQYDKMRKFKGYGIFTEAAMLLEELEKEIRKQASAYEVRKMNGYYTRSAIQRRRALCLMIQIP